MGEYIQTYPIWASMDGGKSRETKWELQIKQGQTVYKQKDESNMKAAKQTHKKRQMGRQTNRKLEKRDKKCTVNIGRQQQTQKKVF